MVANFTLLIFISETQKSFQHGIYIVNSDFHLKSYKINILRKINDLLEEMQKKKILIFLWKESCSSAGATDHRMTAEPPHNLLSYPIYLY